MIDGVFGCFSEDYVSIYYTSVSYIVMTALTKKKHVVILFLWHGKHDNAIYMIHSYK